MVLSAEPGISVAQPVLAPDPEFNPVIVRAGHGLSVLFAVAEDARVYVGGFFQAIDGIPRNGIARLNATGGLDQSFIAELPERQCDIREMALQADGRLLIGGSFIEPDGNTTHGMLRLNPDGTRDSGFRLPVPANHVTEAIAVQNDGRILIGGTTLHPNPKQSTTRIVRLNPDGALDASFSPAVVMPREPIDLAIQQDGKILLWGCFTNVNGTEQSGLARLNADGSVDSSFHQTIEYRFPDRYVCFSSVAPLQDGRLMVGGYFSRRGVLRLLADGSLDTQFYSESFAAPESIHISPDGKVILNREEIVRLQWYGNLDQSFQSALLGRAVSMAIHRDGLLLMDDESQIRRLQSNGALDESFAPAEVEVSGIVGECLQQPDGKLVIIGQFSRVNGAPHQDFARLNADGSVDPSFVPAKDIPSFFLWDLYYGIIRHHAGSGKLLLSGVPRPNREGEPITPRLVQLNPDGSLDRSFAAPITAEVNEMEFQPDGRIIVALATGGWNPSAANALLRLNPDGSIDPSFDWNGFPAEITDFALQPDGKILLTGYPKSGSRAVVTRLNPDGSIDSGFTSNVPNSASLGVPKGITLQLDGRVLVRMESSVILRLNSNGTLDSTFRTPGADPDYWGVAVNGQIEGILETGENIVVFGDLEGTGTFNPFGCCEGPDVLFLNSTGQFDHTVAQLRAPIMVQGGIECMTALSDGEFLVASRHIKQMGSRLSLGGLARLRPVPVIQSVRRNADGSASLRVGGKQGWTSRIETSSDLVNWTLLGDLQSGGPSTGFTDADTSAPRRFYRASLLGRGRL
jgi:uncharacterized delta-60 repeat protein